MTTRIIAFVFVADIYTPLIATVPGWGQHPKVNLESWTPILGGMNQCNMSWVILRDFPYDGALFGLVIY